MVYLSIVSNLCLFAFSSNQMAAWLPNFFTAANLADGDGGNLDNSNNIIAGAAEAATAAAAVDINNPVSGRFGVLLVVVALEHLCVLAGLAVEVTTLDLT